MTATASQEQSPEALDYLIGVVLQSCHLQFTALIYMLFQQQNKILPDCYTNILGSS